jgi:hypothetical protein
MKFFKSLFASANLFTIDSASAKAKVFYEILGRSFHASERGNLNDIKSNSGILVLKAEELSIEAMPAEYRNPKVLESLLTLKKQTKLVDFLIKQNIDDSEIKLALSKLYDNFHSIVELCLSKNSS